MKKKEQIKDKRKKEQKRKKKKKGKRKKKEVHVCLIRDASHLRQDTHRFICSARTTATAYLLFQRLAWSFARPEPLALLVCSPEDLSCHLFV